MIKLRNKVYFPCGIYFLLFAIIPVGFAKAWSAQEAVAIEEPAQRNVLENGMTVITKSIRESSLATALLIVKTGSATEGEFLGSGISHFVEHMLFKGTEKRKVGQIANEVEASGGNINGFTAQDYTGYIITMPTERINTAIEILADAAMHAQFDPDELEKEREVILSEIRMDKDDPDRRMYEFLFANAYTQHPYRHPIIGYEALLMQLRRDDLLKYYTQSYIPNNMALIVTGGISSQEVLAKVKKEFNFSRKFYVPRKLPVEPQQVAMRRVEEAYPTKLTRILMGFKSVSITDKGLFALDVLANILGEGNDCRLYKEIYKKKQLVSSIRAFNFTPMDTGLFAIGCTLEKEKIEYTIDAVLKEIEKVKKAGVSARELKKAKRQVLSSYVFSHQTTSQIAYDLAVNEVMIADPDFSKKYVAQVKRLTQQDIQEAAGKYLNQEALCIALLNPADSKKIVFGDNLLAIFSAPYTFLSAEKKALQKSKPEQILEIKKIVLANGLTVLIKEDHSLPLVAIRASFKGGVRFENEANNGIANLTARMLLSGTKKRSAEAIAKEIESLGARLDSFSGNNSFGISLDAFSEDFKHALDIAADIITNPIFPEDELVLEKERTLALIKAQDDDVFHLAFRPLKRALFGNHPYRFDAVGEKEPVEKITRQDMAGFYHKLCVPGNMVVAVFGDITFEKALQLVKDEFIQLCPKDLASISLLEVFPQKPLEILIPTIKEQAVIALGFAGLRVTDSKRYPLEVLNAILSPMSGRLFLKVREEIGAAYTLGGASVPGIERGMYYLYAATTYENIEKVKEILRKEIVDLQTGYVSDSELEKAKAYLIGEQKSSLETNASRAFTCGLDELYGLGFDNYARYQNKISQVTKEDVMAVAKSYLNLDAAVTIVTVPKIKAP